VARLFLTVLLIFVIRAGRGDLGMGGQCRREGSQGCPGARVQPSTRAWMGCEDRQVSKLNSA
jgi:hypothetical protein